MYSQCANNHYKGKDRVALTPRGRIKGNQFIENLLTLFLRSKAACLLRLPVFTCLSFHFTQKNSQRQFFASGILCSTTSGY